MIKQMLANFVSGIKHASRQAGFTMIELLIVISILGILAVAVLSAINPIEQINRGRDTGSRSDAEQLISAIDRFYAFQGFYPWVNSSNPGTITAIEWTTIGENGDAVIANNAWASTITGCSVFQRLSEGDPDIAGCTGTQELKLSFVNRLSEQNANPLYIYNSGVSGESTYVCFLPASGAFKTEAQKRCNVAENGALPADFPPGACTAGSELICLP